MAKIVNQKSNSFEKNALLVFGLSMFANVMNALFQIISGNLLGTSDYGVINVVNSYVTYLGVFGGPIATMACCYTARLQSEKQRVAGFIRWIIKYSLFIEIAISIVGVIIALLLKPIEGDAFKTILFVVLLLPSNSFYVILLSIVQGMQKFTIHGVIGVVFYGLKMILGIILMVAGWGTFGVVLAMLISQLACVGICFWFLRENLIGTVPKANYGYRDLLEFYGNIFLLQVFYFFYINGGEIIIFALFFENHMVGEYSAAAMLCKLLFYAVTPITTVLLPNVAEKKSQGVDTIKILRKAIFYVMILVGCFGIGLLVLGNKVLLILYGSQYVNAGKYLPIAFGYTFSIIILSIMYSYNTAISNTKKMTVSLIVLSIIIVICIMFFHNDLSSMLIMISILLGIVDIYSFVVAKG